MSAVCQVPALWSSRLPALHFAWYYRGRAQLLRLTAFVLRVKLCKAGIAQKVELSMGARLLAKRQKQQARDTTQGNEELPLCAALLICERVLVEQDQVLSAIRIVDQVAVPANVLANANQLIELPSLQAVGMLKQGNARGMRKVLLSAVSPTGDRAPMGMAMVEFIDAPPDRGGNLVAPMQVIMAGEGVYWLELSIDDAVVARTPLRLKRKTES